MKPTRCTNFSNLFFGIKLYIFRTVPLSIIKSFSLYIQQWYMSYRFADSLWAGPGRSSVLILLAGCQQTCMTYTLAVCTVKSSWWWTEELPKQVEFYSKIKFEKLVHLVGFIIRIYHAARSPERQISWIKYNKRPTKALWFYERNYIAWWSVTRFGHSCDHLQGGENKNINIIKMCLNHFKV